MAGWMDGWVDGWWGGWMGVLLYVCIYVVCAHVCMYACMHERMYACMHECMYSCMYVCMLPIFHLGSPRKMDPTKCQVFCGKPKKKHFFGGLGGVRFPGPSKVANCQCMYACHTCHVCQVSVYLRVCVCMYVSEHERESK